LWPIAAFAARQHFWSLVEQQLALIGNGRWIAQSRLTRSGQNKQSINTRQLIQKREHLV